MSRGKGKDVFSWPNFAAKGKMMNHGLAERGSYHLNWGREKECSCPHGGDKIQRSLTFRKNAFLGRREKTGTQKVPWRVSDLKKKRGA